MIAAAIDILIVGLVVCAISVPLRVKEPAYFLGLFGCVLAAIAWHITGWIADILQLEMSRIVAMLVVAPVLEETARLGMAKRDPGSVQHPRQWLHFGLGFGLFEGVQKLLAALVQHEFSFLAIFVPAVPTLMHIFLSVLALSLFRRGWPLWAVLPTTMFLHAAHNFGVRLIDGQNIEWTFICLALMYVQLIRWVLRSWKLVEIVTSGAPHANTPP